MTLELKVEHGAITFTSDESGVTIRLYSTDNKWLATCGVGLSCDKTHWTTWCADLTKDEQDWTTKHIDREIKNV